MLILSIETSCDETSLAIVDARGGLRAPQYTIKKNLIASQIKTHRPYGGVVPRLAKRDHLTALPSLFKKILPHIPTLGPNAISVTVGPGLEPCLWTGIEFAKDIQKKHFPKARIISTNHLHGHIMSFLINYDFVSHSLKSIFPAIQLLVSGGHTMIVYMKSLTNLKILGATRDDAVGEAFDKVARMIGLPYPGGPEIERIAKNGDPTSINFPRPMMRDPNYEFSFSGLKTAVLYFIKDISRITQKTKNNIAASFQEATTDVLVEKTIRAVYQHSAKSVILSGGVASNKMLQNTLRSRAKSIGAHFLIGPQKYHGDNAVMIGVAGYITHLSKIRYPLKANGNLSV